MSTLANAKSYAHKVENTLKELLTSDLQEHTTTQPNLLLARLSPNKDSKIKSTNGYIDDFIKQNLANEPVMAQRIQSEYL